MNDIPKTKKVGKDRQPKKNVLKETIDQIKKANNLSNLSQNEIIAAYKNNSEDVKKALQELNSKITKTTKAQIITPGKIKGFAYRKAHVKNYKELMQALGPEAEKIPPEILMELVALDDWSSIFKMALPHIIKFGAPYVKKLYDRHIKPLLGGDEGFNPIDWNGSALNPFRYSPAEGLNFFTPSTKLPGSYDAGPTDVSTHSIAVAICPEMYKHRITSIGLYKSALGYITTQYSITANSAGNLGVVIFPDSFHRTFMYAFTDTTFNPLSGDQTPNSSSFDGPFYASVAAFNRVRLCQMSVEIQPSISYSTPGMLTMGYNANFPNTNLTSSMTVGLSDVRTFPFNTGGNAKVIYRMITPFNTPNDLDFLPASSGEAREGFVIFGTGFGSAVTINLVVNTVIEFIPTKAYIPICPMQYPQSGSQTLAFMTQMFAKYPVLQQLTSKDASRVATAVINGSCDFLSLMHIIEEALTGITPAEAPHANIEPMLSLGNERGAIFAFE